MSNSKIPHQLLLAAIEGTKKPYYLLKFFGEKVFSLLLFTNTFIL